MIPQAVAFSGSRSLDRSWSGLVGRVCGALLGAGVRQFAVGDARGADALVVAALRGRAALRIFSVADAPAGVVGPAALALRSQACVRSAQVLVAFFASPESAGTLGACRFAAESGRAVVAFACGAFALPPLGAGAWLPVRSRAFAGAWRWQPQFVQLSFSFAF